MRKAADAFLRLYHSLVLDYPVWVLLALSLIIAFLGYKARDFRIDASAETLMLENDKDLRYSREVVDRYGAMDVLFIAYTPHDGDIMSDASLAAIGHLQERLRNLPESADVLTILDLPLFQSPPISYADISEGIRTLASPETDKALARNEFKTSPFYSKFIVSEDLRTTNIVINLKLDDDYQAMNRQRNRFLDKMADGQDLTEAEKAEFARLKEKISVKLEQLTKAQHENIKTIRAMMNDYRDKAQLYLGGISMIQDDMITFVRNDLKNFGVGVFLLLLVMLGVIFRRGLWVVLPMLCCFLSVVAMMGILAMFGWEVTVISSNFISLQLIITLAIVIHLIVRYREFHRNHPEMDQRALVHATIRSKFIPCLYAALTTIAGFGSLILCDIKPVINFGWMMSAGLIVSLILTFFLFPSAAMLLKKRVLKNHAPEKEGFSVTNGLARFTQGHGTFILAATAVILVLTVVGISRLRVENCFIDYFKASTEIHQGMKLIDQKLGGTTPLDIIIQFDDIDLKQFAESDDEEEDPFADVYDQSGEEDYDKYWFFDTRLDTIMRAHDYMDGLPEIGKVLSLATLLKIGRVLNSDKPLGSIEMAVIYTKLPEKYKELIIKPYLSIQANEARLAVRIIDSRKNLNRDALLRQIKKELPEKLNIAPERIRMAGTMVMYNNMLQSLFSSQIKTMGFVALALMFMFLILFRSFKLALIALFPNLLSAGAVISVMGWLNIPLDMMTITIAAISIGIAVDDTIHYIYRFKEEIKKDNDYYQTLHRCHGTIGHAMAYTSVTIIIGFSILGFSNFWPTIYFGLFTGLAMLVALIAALTLLPQLIVTLKPFGKA